MNKKTVIISILLFFFFTIIIMGSLLTLLFIYSGEQSANLSLSGNRIAVIEISGPIDESGKYIDLLKKSVDNDSYKAIILRINSPGGLVGATQEIYQEVTTARKKGKIIVTSMGDVAASGAYYIASGTNKIVANPGTLTGSIGVIMNFMNWQGLLDNKLGIKFNTIKSGKYKDTGNPNRPMTEEEKQYLQVVIDNVFQQFVNAVVEGRGNAIREILAQKKMVASAPVNQKLADIKKGISYSEITAYIKPFAEGNIYTGEQAYQAGFVDELGNMNTAIRLTAKLAKIEGEPSLVHLRPKEKSFFEKVYGETSEVLSPLKKNGVSLQYYLQ